MRVPSAGRSRIRRAKQVGATTCPTLIQSAALAEVGMGLKDWLAKSARVGAYGGVMGREAVKNGLALGRTLYLGHGTRATASDNFVFEDEDHMKPEGFTLYCADPLHMPPAEDSSELSKQTRAAGIALAAHCSITAAYNFMKEANADTFSRHMGDSTCTEMRQLNLDITFDIVNHYLRLPKLKLRRQRS